SETAAHLSSANRWARAAGARPVTWSSSTPETTIDGSIPAARSVASRAGEAEARTSLVTRGSVSEAYDAPTREARRGARRTAGGGQLPFPGARADDCHPARWIAVDRAARLLVVRRPF